MLQTEKDEDWWDKLPKNIQEEIDVAISELDKGKSIPHEIVVKKYNKWFPTHHKAVLNERDIAYTKDPSIGLDWETVEKELLKK